MPISRERWNTVEWEMVNESLEDHQGTEGKGFTESSWEEETLWRLRWKRETFSAVRQILNGRRRECAAAEEYFRKRLVTSKRRRERDYMAENVSSYQYNKSERLHHSEKSRIGRTPSKRHDTFSRIFRVRNGKEKEDITKRQCSCRAAHTSMLRVSGCRHARGTASWSWLE